MDFNGVGFVGAWNINNHSSFLGLSEISSESHQIQSLESVKPKRLRVPLSCREYIIALYPEISV